MAKITLERLDLTDKPKFPSNTLLDYYDIIHLLMEAVLLKDGFKIKGEGAHKEIIGTLLDLKIIDDQKHTFLQTMRDYRNRVSYEGFMVHKNYIDLNEDLINKTIVLFFQYLK